MATLNIFKNEPNKHFLNCLFIKQLQQKTKYTLRHTSKAIDIYSFDDNISAIIIETLSHKS